MTLFDKNDSAHALFVNKHKLLNDVMDRMPLTGIVSIKAYETKIKTIPIYDGRDCYN